MLSQAEMREIMDAGLHNDTFFNKQEARRWRKEGFKVWAIDKKTAKPYIWETGFATEEDALACIKTNRMGGKAFVKIAEPSDPDYYHDGEKEYYADSYYDDRGGDYYE